MCRHLAYLGPAGHAGGAAARPAARRCCASPTRRATCAAAARSTPTGSASAGTRAPASAPRSATAAPARSGRTPRSPALAAVTPAAARARRGPLGDRRHAGHRGGGRAVRRGPLAVQPQRRGPRLAGRRWPARRRLPVTDLLTLDAPTDAALLWALVRHRLRAGDDPARRARRRRRAVAAAAPGSRLNLLLTDGTAVWATAWDHALSVRVERGRGPRRLRTARRRPRLGGGPGPAPGGGPPRRREARSLDAGATRRRTATA